MDLTTYFRSLRRARWLVLLVPLLVGLLTAGYLVGFTTPAATAALEVTLPISTSSQRTSDQLVDDYRLAALSSEIVQPAAEASGLGLDELSAGLSVSRASTSGSVVRVGVTADDAERARAAVKEVAGGALERVFQPEIDVTLSTREQLRDQFDDLREQAEGAADSGLAASSLQQQQQQLLQSLSAINVTALTLQARLDTAVDQLEAAVVAVERPSRLAQVLPSVLVNAGASLFLFIALLLALELLSGRSSQQQPQGLAPAPDAHGGTAKHAAVPVPFERSVPAEGSVPVES